MRRLWMGLAVWGAMFLPSMAELTHLGMSVARAEEESASGEALLPPETLLFFSVPNMPEFKSRHAASLQGQLLKDRGMQPFLEDVAKYIEKQSKEMEESLGLSMADLWNLPQGELTFAIMEKPARSLSAVILLDYGDHAEQIKTLLTKMDEALSKESVESTTEHEGETIHTYKPKRADPNLPIQGLSYFDDEDGQFIVLGTDVAALKAIIDRHHNGELPTLATSKVYKYVMEKCHTGDDDRDPAVKWFVNPMGLVRVGLILGQKANPQLGMAAGFLPVLGLDQLKGMGGAVDMDVAEYDGLSKTFFYVDQPTSGVLSVFQFPANELTPPKWVADDVAGYFSGTWGAGEAYKAVETLVDGFAGPGATAKQVEDMASSGPGIHLKKDIIDQISGRFHVVNVDNKSKNDAPTAPKYLIGLGLKDSGKVEKLLTKLSNSPQFGGKKRSFNGVTLYEMDSPGSEEDVSLAVAEGNLFMTNETALLEGVLRADSSRKPLADSAAYKKHAGYFAGKNSMVSFARPDSQIKMLLNAAKEQGSFDFLPGIDFKKLPSFDVLRTYFRPGASYTVPEKQGVSIIGFSLKDE